jgi:A/G-specific adenine glycosylase
MIFIETNIRRVFLYFFFPNREAVKDKEILTILTKTIDKRKPREWYYALMDYGVMLKKIHPDLNKKSAHYRKQTPFNGSTRQIRGKILDFLLRKKNVKAKEIYLKFEKIEQKSIKNILGQLEKEGFIELYEDSVKLA